MKNDMTTARDNIYILHYRNLSTKINRFLIDLYYLYDKAIESVCCLYYE